MSTHVVTNQVPELVDFDAADNPAISEAVHRAGADHMLDDLHRIGRLAGGAEALGWGDLAESHPPELRTHDRYGNRVDEVTYDPAYHHLMRRVSVSVSVVPHGRTRVRRRTSSVR